MKKLLLWNNLILNNNIYVKNYKNWKGDFVYPCLFKELVGKDTIKIFFEFDIRNFEKNKDYKVNSECLIIIPEFVYNYFIIKHNKNQTFPNDSIFEENSEKLSEISDYMEYKAILSEGESESEENFKNKKKKNKKSKNDSNKKIKEESFSQDQEEEIKLYPKNKKKK